MKLITLGDLSLQGSAFKRPKALLLLVFLALEGKQERRHLAELFWFGQANALANLSLTLSRLNKAVPGGLEMDHTYVACQLPCDVLDLSSAFEQADYDQVISLYTGAFLQGVANRNWCWELEEWVYSIRENTAEKLRTAYLKLAQQSAALEDYAHAAHLAEQAYHVHCAPPADVAELKQLFLLLRATNHHSAKAVHDEAASYNLDLAVSMREAREQLTPHRFLGSSRPPQAETLTPFVGRDDDLCEIISQLLEPAVRLLCITGIGGAGKTRLARVVITQEKLLNHFPDGLYFIPLENLQDARLIPLEIAAALDLQPTDKDLWFNLANLLANKRVLLVLDSLEHVIDEAAVDIENFLMHCPQLCILATSREVLNIPGELTYELKGLRIPSDVREDFMAYGATELFITLAKRVKRSFGAEANKEPILAICRQLEGLPLGIELAITWIRQRTCQDIAVDLRSNLDILSTRSRTVTSRHKSARAAFEHSWQLLSNAEQAALAKLSVFTGGFKAEAAFEVTRTALPLLAALIDKSLLRVDAQGRYNQHTLIHQFAREKLNADDSQLLRGWHADYFLKLAQNAQPHLQGQEQSTWLARLDEELENLLAALSFLSEEDCDRALRLVLALGRYWEFRGYYQPGHAWLQRLLNQLPPGELPALRYEALRLSGLLLWRQQNDDAHAVALVERSLAGFKQLGDQHNVALSLQTLGLIADEQGHYPNAGAYFLEGLSLFRELGDDYGLAASLNSLGNIAHVQSDYLAADAHYRESLKLRKALGDLDGVAVSLLNLGIIGFEQHQYENAARLCEQSTMLFRDLGNQRGLVMSLGYLAVVAHRLVRYEQANKYGEESLRLCWELGDQRLLAYQLAHLAVAIVDVDATRSVTLFAVSHAICVQRHFVLNPPTQALVKRSLEKLREKLTGMHFDSLWEIASALSLKEAFQVALDDLSNFGA